jgi:hypothetical protein
MASQQQQQDVLCDLDVSQSASIREDTGNTDDAVIRTGGDKATGEELGLNSRINMTARNC